MITDNKNGKINAADKRKKVQKWHSFQIRRSFETPYEYVRACVCTVSLRLGYTHAVE